MHKAKRRRGRDDLNITIDDKNKGACKTELVAGRFLAQDVWDGLNDVVKLHLSKSVASIALCDGDTILFSCSGIAMERQGYNIRFLTTASLVTAMNGINIGGFGADLKIKVRHEDDEVCVGSLAEFDLNRNFAVIAVSGFDDFQFGPFERALEALPRAMVFVALGRGVDGKIMAKSVESNSEGISEDDEDLRSETSGVWEGGPLLFVDHVVGMNLFLTEIRAIYRPWDIILKHLDSYSTYQENARFGARTLGDKSITYPHTVQGYYYFKDLALDLDSDGYPKLPSNMLGAGMVLVNTFEETFGNTYGKGVWKKFSNGGSNIRRNIVALASFTGGKRFFACTGFFVEWMGSPIILTSASLVRSSNDDNNIVENFKIEVLLPNDQYTEGTIQHYNLHYNVALVSVKDYRGHRPFNIVPRFIHHFEVAAVGRYLKKGELLAKGEVLTICGDLVDWTGTLDCWDGGPLVNLHGDVVGMNFFDKRLGTPFLAWENICKILAMFEKSVLHKARNGSDPPEVPDESSWKLPGDETGVSVLNRWPVPMPHWCHPEFWEDKSVDDDAELVTESGHRKYTYINGMKYMLF